MEKRKQNLGRVRQDVKEGIEIPGDVSEEILSKLPVKSLLRFSFVNTTWYSLIRNPNNFISKHLLNHRASGFEHVLVNPRSETTSGYSWMVSDPSLRNLSFVGNLNNIEDTYIVGECDGLICFMSGSGEPNFDFLKPCVENANRENANREPDDLDSRRPNVALNLWNPAIRQHKILPESNILLPRPKYRMVGMGFGHDPKSGDYKIVRFAIYQNYLNGVGFDMEAEVYSLRSDSWRPVAKVILETNPSTTCGGVCLGGFCYWIGCKHGHLSTIISFDMSNEVFRQFHLPELVRFCPPGPGYMWSKLLVWKGSLALVMSPSSEGLLPSYVHTGNVRFLHIWSLDVDGPLTVKEHKDLYLDLNTIMDLDVQMGLDVQGPLRMDVELLCNDDLIIKFRNKGLNASSARFKASSTRFKAYNISTGQIRNISLVGTYSCNTRMVGYTPSLVSLFP